MDFRRGEFYEEESSCTRFSGRNGTRYMHRFRGERNKEHFRDIKIVVDGKEVSTSAEPFIYNGTTYLPIRAVGEAVGKEVTWNAGTNTVYLGEVPTGAQQAQESAKQQPAAPETPASETPAPETPAPAASSSLPILLQFGASSGVSKEEIQETILMLHSGQVSAHEIYDTYCWIIEDAISKDDIQYAKAAYAEGLLALSYTKNDPDYVSLKKDFDIHVSQYEYFDNM